MSEGGIRSFLLAITHGIRDPTYDGVRQALIYAHPITDKFHHSLSKMCLPNLLPAMEAAPSQQLLHLTSST